MVVYELAFHLKLPIYKLSAEMPYEEFLGWMDYLDKRPIEWRDDDRTFKNLQAQGVKEKPWNIFPSLKNIYKAPAVADDGSMSIENLKGSTLFSRMLTATKGDKLDIWSE